MGKYTFSGVDYELPIGVDGQVLVDGYKAKGLTDTVIAGVLAAVGKVIATAMKKSADTIFENVKAKTAARQDVKDAMPKLAKMWARQAEIDKLVDEAEGVVLTACKEEAGKAGLLADAIALDFDSEHKLVFHPVKHTGGSTPGTTRANGAGTITFTSDFFTAKDSVIQGDNKQDLGEQLWKIVEPKWAGMKPSPYQGVMKYNKFLDNFIAKASEHVRYDHQAPSA